MNPNADDHPLREKIWRHELTPAEQAELRAWLAAHPEAQADWEAEKDLSRLLTRLPDASVPSNFTARVLQAVEREACIQERTKISRPWWLRVLILRAAAAVVMASLGFFAYHRYEVGQRTTVAKSLSVVAGVESVPNPQALQDFDVVRRLGSPAADEELLALMK